MVARRKELTVVQWMDLVNEAVVISVVPEIVIDGAGHAFSDRRILLIESILGWLDERFEQKRGIS